MKTLQQIPFFNKMNLNPDSTESLLFVIKLSVEPRDGEEQLLSFALKNAHTTRDEQLFWL